MQQNLLTIAYFTLLEAARNRLLYLVAVIIAAALLLTFFLKHVAITESGDIQVAFLAAMLRIAAVFVIAAFVVVSQVREANDKVMDMLLTRDLSRAEYLFGKLFGYLAAALLLAVLFMLPLCFFVPVHRALTWGLSLFFELSIVAAMSLFCVMTFNQTVGSLLAVAGFYALSRSMAALQLIGTSRFGEGNFWIDKFANSLLDIIAFFLPRLDLFTQTGWLLGHGTPLNVPWLVAQSVIYAALLSFAALFDLKRKNL